MAVGAATACGGDGSARCVRGRERRGGDGDERERERPRGVRGVVEGLQQRAGKQEVAGVCSRAAATRVLSFCQRRKKTGEPLGGQATSAR